MSSNEIVHYFQTYIKPDIIVYLVYGENTIWNLNAIYIKSLIKKNLKKKITFVQFVQSKDLSAARVPLKIITFYSLFTGEGHSTYVSTK